MTLSLWDPDLLGVVAGGGGIGAIACLRDYYVLMAGQLNRNLDSFQI